MKYQRLLAVLLAISALAAGCSQAPAAIDGSAALAGNDKFAILDIFKEKFPAYASTIKLDYTTSSATYARGNITLDARGEQRGIFFAKNDAGEWGVMYFKNGEYFCSDVQVLNLPSELTDDCQPSLPDLTTDDAKAIRVVLSEVDRVEPESLIVNIENHSATSAGGYSTDDAFNNKKYFTVHKTGDSWQVDNYSSEPPSSIQP